MLKSILKNLINDTVEMLAFPAVRKAENILGSGKGEQKKIMAVNFVMAKLKLPAWLEFLRPCFKNTLYAIVDKAVETAVEKLHRIQNRILAGV